jgi:signal transduction histidine kinase
VGIDMQSVNRRMNEFLRRYGLLSAAMLACLMLLQAWIVRHSLSVLGRVRAELALVGQGGAHTVDEHVPSEIAPLVREINHLSRAMAQRLQRSRQALGNLAHALKTPLTVLSQLAQDSFNDRPNIAQALEHQVRTLRRRVDLELKRARLAGHGGMAQRVDLCEEMRALTDTIAQIHGTKHLDIVCDAPPAVHFHGDREDMLELFGNLLDNACKYANKTVLISVRSEVGVRATFEDDGPGCAPEHFELLTQRGVRLDESVHGDGLGLAIVADIVESYRGKVEFSRSERLGGLCASVWLPLGRAPA